MHPSYRDDDTLCVELFVEGGEEAGGVEAAGAGAEGGGGAALRLLLSRDAAEYDVAKRRRG